MSEALVAFVTTGSLEEAERIAKTLVQERLAACVNIIPQVLSIYRWEDTLEQDHEAKMVIKTRQELMDALVDRVKQLHSYEVCEVTCVPIVGGNRDYLAWIQESTRDTSDR